MAKTFSSSNAFRSGGFLNFINTSKNVMIDSIKIPEFKNT
jgi:hypothetical protein